MLKQQQQSRRAPCFLHALYARADRYEPQPVIFYVCRNVCVCVCVCVKCTCMLIQKLVKVVSTV